MPLAAIDTLLSPPSFEPHGDSVTLLHPPGGRSAVPLANGIVLDTLFDVRRGYYDPKISLTERRDGTVQKVPPQPQPVSLGPAGILAGAGALLGGLMGMGALTGAQIDSLRECTPLGTSTKSSAHECSIKSQDRIGPYQRRDLYLGHSRVDTPNGPQTRRGPPRPPPPKHRADYTAGCSQR